MIQLYLALAKKLREIPKEQLPLIDIDGTEGIKTHTSAYIKLGKLHYEQQNAGNTMAQLPIYIDVNLNPQHSSESSSPVLDALASSFDVVELVKSKLLNEGIDCISGIMLTGEDLVKQKGKYTAKLELVGLVEYEA